MDWLTPVSDPATGAFLKQLTAAPIVVLAIEYVKESKLFPFFTNEMKTAQKFVGFLAALATTMGIHGNFAGSLLYGGQLTVSLGLVPIVLGLYHTLNTWATQEFVYMAKQKLTAKPVVEVVK